MSNTLCDILSDTLISLLSLELREKLSDDDKPKEICRKLVSALGEYESNVGNDLNSAFVFLSTAVADLEVCFENLEESGEPSTSWDDNTIGDQRLIFYTPLASQLVRELCKIRSGKAKEKFSFAISNFRKANAECSEICEIPTLGLQTRITATKFRVIAEILGNLHNLNDAAEKCMKIISELHEYREIQSLFNTTQTKFKRFVNRWTGVEFEETKSLSSVVKISEAVLTFRKKFIRKPVAIFDWLVINERNPQTFHPIVVPSTMRSTPDLSVLSTSIENNELEIDSCISAINCKGEVFAKYNGNSFAIVRIVDGLSFLFWRLTEKKASELKIEGSLNISSISVDSNDCTFPKNADDFHKDCKSNLFVLAKHTYKKQSGFLLFVIDIHGKLLHTAKLTCLPRRKVTSETVRGNIFCTKDKLLIYDLSKGKAYLCDKNGELEKPLNMTGQKPETPMASTISDENRILVLEKPNKIHFYDIKQDCFCDDQKFETHYELRATAYNHTLNEVNLLCRSGLTSKKYHLMRYTKTGELKQDIKLQEDLFDFNCASLVSHPSGPVVLFDNKRLLYLK